MKFMTKDQITKSVSSIGTRATTLQNDIHRTGVSILKIWHDAGDNDRSETADWAAASLTALQNASPYHSVAFAKWVSMFTPLLFDQDSKTWTVTGDENRIYGKTFMAARDTAFWKVAPPAQLKPVNLLEIIQGDLEKSRKRRTAKEDKKHVEDMVDLDLENRIRQVISDYKLEKGIA